MKKFIYDARQLPAFLSVTQYAELMNLSTVTVRKLCRNGTLPATRLGNLWRIDKNKALDIMNGHAIKPQ